MTSLKEHGLKVGDKIQYLDELQSGVHSMFNVGDILKITEENDGIVIRCKNQNKVESWFSLTQRKWAIVK